MLLLDAYTVTDSLIYVKFIWPQRAAEHVNKHRLCVIKEKSAYAYYMCKLYLFTMKVQETCEQSSVDMPTKACE